MADSQAPSSLDAAVVAAVESERSVLAAYVYGSRARGEGGAGSDLDVVLLFDADALKPAGIEERVGARLARATGFTTDVAVLRHEAPVLAFEILDGGRRAFVRDADRTDEIEERLLRAFLDTAYLRRVQNHYLLGTPL